MKRFLLTVLFAVSSVAFAEPTTKELLDEKMRGMEVFQMGMCDGLRTTLVVHRSKDERTAHEFIGFSGARYVVVKEGTDDATAKKLYFTRKQDEVVQNSTPMDWGVPLLQDGPNFFIFHFFPTRPNDCGLSQQMK